MLYSSDLELKPVGALEVKLVQAKDLTNKDIVGKSDPFAKLFIRPLREKTKRSKTIVRLPSFFFELITTSTWLIADIVCISIELELGPLMSGRIVHALCLSC